MNNNVRMTVLMLAFILTVAAVSIFDAVQISSLNNRISDMENQSSASFANIPGAPNTGGAAPEVTDSQDKLVTSAVARTIPAVVSVTISKQVPKSGTSYTNPLEDSILKSMGIAVPVSKSKGSQLEKVGAGSGFLISHDGYILTNKHVVIDPQALYQVQLSDSTKRDAKVVYRDPNLDIAVMKIEGTYPTVVSLGDSSKLKLGQTVVAIGNALGEYGNSVSVGSVSGVGRNIQATDDNGNMVELDNVLQTDVSVNPGNSGGPLLDISGNVVGMNVATVFGSNNINFSIPVNSIKKSVRNYM